ncbi:MAG: hypothetical protein K6T56_10155 [Burkholderiales bacterium]|jgi:hypothetical protein|nr:hypothetical protein [Burkholderiales bacterium]
MLKVMGKILAAFTFFVLFVESVAAAVRWWHGDALTLWQKLAALALPLLIFVWARYFSVFGCHGKACVDGAGRGQPGP